MYVYPFNVFKYTSLLISYIEKKNFTYIKQKKGTNS